MNRQKGLALPIILIILISVVGLSFYFFRVFGGQTNSDFGPVPPEVSPTDSTSDWKTYRNEQYSFNYPSSWNILETVSYDLRIGPLGSEKTIVTCKKGGLPGTANRKIGEEKWGSVLMYSSDFGSNGLRGIKEVIDVSSGQNIENTFWIALANKEDGFNCGFYGSLGAIKDNQYEKSLNTLTTINQILSTFKFLK